MRSVKFSQFIIFLLFLLVLCVVGCNKEKTDLVDIDIFADDLLSLGLIDDDDLKKDYFMSNYEALDLIKEIKGANYSYLGIWYEINELKSLDHLDDNVKIFLLGLHMDNILTLREMRRINLDDYLTYNNALKFAIRLIAETFTCTDSPKEIYITNKFDIYEIAFEKGLINSRSTRNASHRIPRIEFYNIINKAINFDFSVGGVAPSMRRYVDFIPEIRNYRTERKEVVLAQSNEISVEYKFENDMSVSWDLSSSYSHLLLDKVNTYITVHFITNDDEKIFMFSYSLINFSDGIKPEDIIIPLINAYPKTPKYFNVVIEKYNFNISEKEEWKFSINIPDINVVITDDEINPGTFTAFRNQWVPETITLKKGQIFKANAYYIISSYEHRYRRPEFNSQGNAIIKIGYDSNMINNEKGMLKLNTGGLYLDEVRIREVQITGNPIDGFTLLVTPESKNTFRIRQGSVRRYN